MKHIKITINPNQIRTRDLVHMQEITHGSGTGAHRSKRDYNRGRDKIRLKREEWNK